MNNFWKISILIISLLTSCKTENTKEKKIQVPKVSLSKESSKNSTKKLFEQKRQEKKELALKKQERKQERVRARVRTRRTKSNTYKIDTLNPKVRIVYTGRK